MRLEPIANPTLTRSFALPFMAIAATVIIASLLAMVAGANPFSVLGLILHGAAGSKFALLETLNRATPLIFTGLAVAVAFRAKLWNIGAEAQLYAGALITVVLGTGALAWPSGILLPTLAILAMLAGAVVLLVPALLKVRFGIRAVIVACIKQPTVEKHGIGFCMSARTPGSMKFTWTQTTRTFCTLRRISADDIPGS